MYFRLCVFSIIVVTSIPYMALLSIEAKSQDWDKRIAILLSNHPELKSQRETLRSLLYEKETVGILPDPKIGFAYRSYPVRGRNPLSPDLRTREDTPGMTGRELSIIQEIPYPDKLRSDKNLVYWEYMTEKEKFRILKNEFLGNFYLLLVEKHFIQTEIDSWKNVQTVLRSISHISQANFSSGQENSSNYLTDKNEAERMKDKLLELETQSQELEKSLEYYYYNSNQEEKEIFVSEIRNHLDAKWLHILNLLNRPVQNLALRNPNTKLLESGIHKAQEVERRDLLEFYPDSEVFLSYMKRNSRNFRISENPLNYGSIMPTDEFSGDLLSFGVTLKIPAWSLAIRKDLHLKNRSLKDKEIQARVALERKMESEIQRLIKTIEGANKRIESYSKEILPTYQKSVRIASGNIGKGYDSVLRFRLEYLKARAELVNLERQKYRSILQLLELSDCFILDESLDLPSRRTEG